jgi:FKBP-type peptidyl-prolyl cis-trans isomerase (trigger factor)
MLSKEALALVLQYAGVTAQAAEKALIKAFEDVIAETNGKAVGAVADEYKAIVEKGMKHVEAIVEKLPKVTCKGPITGHMQYDAVEATSNSRRRVAVSQRGGLRPPQSFEGSR